MKRKLMLTVCAKGIGRSREARAEAWGSWSRWSGNLSLHPAVTCWLSPVFSQGMGNIGG